MFASTTPYNVSEGGTCWRPWLFRIVFKMVSLQSLVAVNSTRLPARESHALKMKVVKIELLTINPFYV